MNIYAFSSLLNIIGSISIGLFILTRYKRDTRYVTFGLFCLVSFIWSFYYFLWQMTTNERLALLYCRNMMIGAIFIPIFYLHHVLSLLGQAQRKKLILHIGYILSFIFLLFDFTPYFISNLTPKLVFKFHPNPGPVYSYYMVYWISCVLYALYLLIDGLRSSTGLLHKQIKYMLIAALIAWGGGATNYPLWYDIPMLPIGNLLVFLYVPTAAYAMIKHKLMDIEIVMARSFILICIYIPIILFAFAIKAWGDHILYPIFGDKWIFVPFTAVAVLSFAGSFSYL